MKFPVIERYRAELLASGFVPLDDAALEELRQAEAEMHHSNAIEGIHPSPETAALFEMLLEIRVPPDVSQPFVKRYLKERIVSGEYRGNAGLEP